MFHPGFLHLWIRHFVVHWFFPPLKSWFPICNRHCRRYFMRNSVKSRGAARNWKRSCAQPPKRTGNSASVAQTLSRPATLAFGHAVLACRLVVKQCAFRMWGCWAQAAKNLSREDIEKLLENQGARPCVLLPLVVRWWYEHSHSPGNLRV